MITELIEPHDFGDDEWVAMMDENFYDIPQASDWDERIDPEILTNLEDDYRDVWEG